MFVEASPSDIDRDRGLKIFRDGARDIEFHFETDIDTFQNRYMPATKEG